MRMSLPYKFPLGAVAFALKICHRGLDSGRALLSRDRVRAGPGGSVRYEHDEGTGVSLAEHLEVAEHRAGHDGTGAWIGRWYEAHREDDRDPIGGVVERTGDRCAGGARWCRRRRAQREGRFG
jgi:hypothetical protein